MRPTYVITHPVAVDPRSADVLRELLAGGDCEIGAHHHAWETPPCTADDVRRHPYAANLPLRQFEAQLESLTSAIEEAVGRRPVSYRSGRFGFSSAHVPALEALGYQVESSVAPLFYEAHKNGPDFVEAPLTPYFLGYDSATTPGTSAVLEVPVSAALDRRLPKRLQYLYARAPQPYTTKRVLRKLGLARVRWLRPSYSSLEDMVSLARDLAEAGEPVLNLLFHSSEAIVGGSPYNRTDDELSAFCVAARAVLRLRAYGAPGDSRDVRRVPPRVSDSARPGAGSVRRRTSLMRIVHVTPHLPPDQAANALLPFQLGQWAQARGRPCALRRASTANGAGRRRRREHPVGGRARHLDSPDAPIMAADHAQDRLDCRRAAHSARDRRPVPIGGRRARAQQRPPRGGQRGTRQPGRRAGGAHALRHRDLALPAEAARSRPVHARVFPRRPP